MLRVLKYILLLALSCKHCSVWAHEETAPLNLLRVVNEVADQLKQVSRKEIVDRFLSLKNMQSRSEELELYKHKKANLRIFVSSSMPISMLRAYSMEAAKYGGSLVFKGLPGGSFKELIKLVMQISNEGAKGEGGFGHIQIDDQVFEKFGIDSVPSIVLSKNEGEGFLSTDNEQEEFDKVEGAIEVRLALEKFAESRDLKEVAERRLGK